MLKKLNKLIKSDDLKGKFTKGGIVLSGASVFEIGLRFTRNIILTRLLAPEYFGLMATIISVIAISNAFTEVGIRQAVIQNKKGDEPEFLNTAWWMSCLRGTVLYLIALFAAPYICNFYSSPEIITPMRCAFSVLFFSAAISPKMHVLEKQLSFFKFIIINQGSALLNVTIAIVASIYFRNVWPLVIGLILEDFGRVFLSFLFLPFRPRFKVDWSSFNEILKFARGMFGLPVLSSIFFQFDIVFIGKLLNMEQLGLYSIARSFALFMVIAFGKIVRPLLLPTFSKLQDNYAALRDWLLKITDLTGLVCIPIIAFCIMISKTLLSVLYGPRYGSVSIAFSILMLYVMIRLFSTILMQLYFALAKPDLQRRFAFVRVVIVLILGYPATKTFGLVGASLTVMFGMASLFILQVVWAMKLINMKIADYLICLIRGLLISSLVILPGMVFKFIFQETEILLIVVGVFLCFISWAIALNTSHYKTIILGVRS